METKDKKAVTYRWEQKLVDRIDRAYFGWRARGGPRVSKEEWVADMVNRGLDSLGKRRRRKAS